MSKDQNQVQTGRRLGININKNHNHDHRAERESSSFNSDDERALERSRPQGGEGFGVKLQAVANEECGRNRPMSVIVCNETNNQQQQPKTTKSKSKSEYENENNKPQSDNNFRPILVTLDSSANRRPMSLSENRQHNSNQRRLDQNNNNNLDNNNKLDHDTKASKSSKQEKKKKRKHSFDSIFSLDSEFDEFDTQAVRFKPESLDNLVKLTKFNRRELKLMYRGFKQLCPSGVVKEDKFKVIYAQFFPRGAETNSYARFVFNSFDVQRKQQITFTDFVIGLSVLTRGSCDEQLRWIFTLYDLNGDGCITREELGKIVNSVHDLMGKFALNSAQAAALSGAAAAGGAGPDTPRDCSPTTNNNNNNKPPFIQASPFNFNNHNAAMNNNNNPTTNTNVKNLITTTGSNNNNNQQQQQQLLLLQQQQQQLQQLQQLNNQQQAEMLFQKFDLNKDGVITLDEFLEACYKDDNIIKSISVFNTIL